MLISGNGGTGPVLSRRRVLSAAVPAAALLQSSRPGLAQAAFPSRPLRVLLGFPAGGALDAVFRIIARNAEPVLGQPVVIENRPGAGGTVSIIQMKNAVPDGYTLGIVTMGVFRVPVMEDVAYDPLRDITYIVGLSSISFGIVVRASSPFRNWAELLAHGKARPGEINYGVAAGLGNSGHLLIEEMTAQEGIKWNPIPYRGGADTQQALLAGDIPFAVDASASFGPLVDSGHVRLIAMANTERSRRWPEVPTTIELGYRATSDSPWGLGGRGGFLRSSSGPCRTPSRGPSPTPTRWTSCCALARMSVTWTMSASRASRRRQRWRSGRSSRDTASRGDDSRPGLVRPARQTAKTRRRTPSGRRSPTPMNSVRMSQAWSGDAVSKTGAVRK